MYPAEWCRPEVITPVIRCYYSATLVAPAGGELPFRMAAAETLPATPSIPAGPSVAAVPRTEPPEFPGCNPVHLPRAEIERYEGRLEYWDATIETAWICEPTTSYHERPARLLTRSAERIAVVRGSHIECYGSMDLLLRDERGEPQRIMQADESLYLHPAHAKLPGAAMVVGEDDFPDVVLEVDHTTDARRGKLPLYESWGFPEVWVDVPDAPSPSRPRARRPGLAIHLLEDGRYRVAAESRAFPGWTAAEIHEALNEADAVGAHQRGVGAGGRSAGGAGRNRTGRRPAVALATASRLRARPSGRTHSGPSGRTPCRRAASPRRNDPPDTGVARYRGLGGVPGRRGVRRRTRGRADFGGARLRGRGGIPHRHLSTRSVTASLHKVGNPLRYRSRDNLRFSDTSASKSFIRSTATPSGGLSPPNSTRMWNLRALPTAALAISGI